MSVITSSTQTGEFAANSRRTNLIKFNIIGFLLRLMKVYITQIYNLVFDSFGLSLDVRVRCAVVET